MRLLNYLLNYFLFAGTMFFAAGAPPVVDAGAGGGDDGAGSGSDAGGADIGADGAASGDGLSNQGDGTGSDDSTTDDGTGTGDGTSDPNAQPIRGVPQKFAELYKADKDFRNLWESAKSLRQTFPGGVKEAVQLAKTIQEFGGLDGIEQVKADLDGHIANAELLSKDPAKWIESEFQAQPELALKSFALSLDYVADNHPEHYNHLVSQIELNDINGEGGFPVRAIYDILAGLKDNPQAQEAAQKLANFYNTRKDMSKKVPVKQKNEALEKREQTITQKEQEIRKKTINTEAVPYMNKAIGGVLQSAAKAAGFDLGKIESEQPGRYQRFMADVQKAIHSEVLKDPKFIDRYTAALASGDTAKCVRMLNARHDQAIKGDGTKAGVVAPVFHEWFGPPKAAKRTPEGGNNNPAPVRNGAPSKTPKVINYLPPAREIDYNWEGTSKFDGLYRLKTGELIQVKRT